ncbi:hypothetical protein NG99_03780 [Erwinia typographi]|uniref:HTH tetR-type domain-containing protein n=1 Tax=Erwinia typographi TaxID=371042 RepID=A0A0A3Z8R1_9GAMM|nr:TetR/AcrR family transcriptional regulator [Erwinia typographi]KGT95462.1 hypothetical protein NG99_03780 [Erwinia typographi]
MVRKAENARERFGRAALQLFQQQGYAGTTVSQIASAAGLTERTFFRYFVDKPEVLFWHSEEIQSGVVRAIHAAGEGNPLDIALAALQTIGEFFDGNRAEVAIRHAIIDATVEFQERELMKMYQLAEAISLVLTERGASSSQARMTASISVTLWRLAINDWLVAKVDCAFSLTLMHTRAALEEIIITDR